MTQQYKKFVEGNIDGFLKIHPSAKLHGVWLDCTGGIIIEKDVDISRNVNIFTHSHQFNKSHWHNLPIIKNPIRICEGAFIGINSVILAAVEIIGKWSVIGAGSVLTKSVLDYEIWAGNPARKIGEVKNE